MKYCRYCGSVELNDASLFCSQCRKNFSKSSLLKSVPVSNKPELKELIDKTILEKGVDCDLNFIDVSKVTDMSYLFKNVFFVGDISRWNVSNVTNMKGMFLKSKFNGNISNWNVSNVEDMSYMFYESFFNGDISNWNVSNVSDMSFIFCMSAFKGNLSKWDISNVTDIRGMFESDCNYNFKNNSWKFGVMDFLNKSDSSDYLFINDELP